MRTPEGEVSPHEWLRDAYLRIDHAIEPLVKLGITPEEKEQMEDYLKQSSEEAEKAIWLLWNMFSHFDAMEWMRNK